MSNPNTEANPDGTGLETLTLSTEDDEATTTNIHSVLTTKESIETATTADSSVSPPSADMEISPTSLIDFSVALD